MGIHMSENLSKSGFSVTGYDINKDVFENIKYSQIKQAFSIDELCQKQDCIITMLPNSEIVSEVWNELFRKGTENTLVIDCSTIDVETTKSLHNDAHKFNFLALDAPVSGGTVGAENQSLTFMVGGESNAYSLAEPILNSMGKKVFHCGSAGSGQAVKMCNNLLLAITMTGLGEVIKLSNKSQLDQNILYDVISTSTGSCWALNNYSPLKGIGPDSPADKNFKPGFSSNLMLKDLLIAANAMQGLDLKLSNFVINKYKDTVNDGLGHLDFSSIVDS